MTAHIPQAPQTAPASWYVDPALWPIERKHIFAENWQFVTHESAVAEPRSWRADVPGRLPGGRRARR
ncbi:MAG: hypothetical protein WDN06_07185 [Asticcacaulis sp.]